MLEINKKSAAFLFFLTEMFIGQTYAVAMILQWSLAFWYFTQKYVLCPHLIVLILQQTGLYLYGPSVAHNNAAAINQRNGDITEGRREPHVTFFLTSLQESQV